MARLTSTLASRIALLVLLAHGVMLPVLFFGLMQVVERNQVERFIEQVRGFAHVVADAFELSDALDSPERSAALLDSAILRSDGVYAELVDSDRTIKSTLGLPELVHPAHQDLGVNQGGDEVYYIMLPLERKGHRAELWLGFDEKTIKAQVADARSRILIALGVYFAATMLLALLVGRSLSRPLIELKNRSRRVASGDYAIHLSATTSLREVHELGRDLEHMRGELVGVSQRLRREIEAKEAVESERRSLEGQLRRRHRLETVGTLAGGVAHEFNNALVPIILYTESLLADVRPDGAEAEQLLGVLSAARRARDIVRKVLAFTREFESAQLGPVLLASAVDEALKLFTALAPASIDVRRELPGEIPEVTADQGLLTQLIMNLCTNAYQAMLAGGGILTIGVRVDRSVAPPIVELYVRDTGHGMDAATVERIFEPFFTTREVGDGTGLGLAVVHGIATRFGASIIVESAVGRGTTMRVRFPPAGAAVQAPETDELRNAG
jgi:signal transduction histidine kinase